MDENQLVRKKTSAKLYLNIKVLNTLDKQGLKCSIVNIKKTDIVMGDLILEMYINAIV